jgi:hypothetical protein
VEEELRLIDLTWFRRVTKIKLIVEDINTAANFLFERLEEQIQMGCGSMPHEYTEHPPRSTRPTCIRKAVSPRRVAWAEGDVGTERRPPDYLIGATSRESFSAPAMHDFLSQKGSFPTENQ